MHMKVNIVAAIAAFGLGMNTGFEGVIVIP